MPNCPPTPPIIPLFTMLLRLASAASGLDANGEKGLVEVGGFPGVVP